jgi:hypothetical protein
MAYDYSGIVSSTHGGGGGSTVLSRPLNYDPAFGGVPSPINVGGGVADAIAAALKNFGSLSSLAGKTNSFNQNEILDQLKKALPGYEKLIGKSAGIIGEHLSGVLPQDVQDTIQNSTAAQALAGGYGGSGLHSNNMAKTLGLTSLDLQRQGLTELLSSVGSAKSTATAQPFDLSRFMVSPTEAIEVQALNNAAAAAPDPKAQAAYQENLWQKFYGGGPGSQWKSGGGAITGINFGGGSPSAKPMVDWGISPWGQAPAAPIQAYSGTNAQPILNGNVSVAPFQGSAPAGPAPFDYTYYPPANSDYYPGSEFSGSDLSPSAGSFGGADSFDYLYDPEYDWTMF